MAQMLRAMLVGVMLIGLAACAATYDNHGYAPSDADLDGIIVGLDTRDTVDEVIGRPTAAGLLNEGGYYYVKSRWRNYAYRKPQVVDRQVVAISFDERGVVSNVERFGLERGQVVALSRRVTQPNTQGISFIRQLLGNIGNFNPAQVLN